MDPIYIEPINDKSMFMVSPEDNRDYAQSIYVTECFRCFGGIMIWKRKPGINNFSPLYCTLSYHILPGSKRYIKSMSSYLFKKIHKLEKTHHPMIFARCGGRLDTPKNRTLYKWMMKKIDKKIKYKFPNLKTIGFYPEDEKPYYSTIYMNEEFNLFVELFEQTIAPE